MSAAVSDTVWALLASALAVGTVAAHFRRPWVTRLSVLCRRALAYRTGAIAALVLWMWTGWHFFAR